MPALTILGLLAGVGIAAWLLKREGDDVQLIDWVGDLWVQMTTSEEQRIAQLQPEVQAEFRSLLADWSQAGILVDVGQTLRTAAQEKSLVEMGRTSKNLKVSWHQLGRAVDVYPVDPDTGVGDRDGKHLDRFRLMHAIAERRGWRSLAFNADGSKRLIENANGKLIWDGGHIEWREPYSTIAQAISTEGSNFGLG
jgi:hypothetical protein